MYHQVPMTSPTALDLTHHLLLPTHPLMAGPITTIPHLRVRVQHLWGQALRLIIRLIIHLRPTLRRLPNSTIILRLPGQMHTLPDPGGQMRM